MPGDCSQTSPERSVTRMSPPAAETTAFSWAILVVIFHRKTLNVCMDLLQDFREANTMQS